MGKVLTKGAGTIFNAACKTIGTGLGLVILGSMAAILNHLGFRNEMAEILSLGIKFK